LTQKAGRRLQTGWFVFPAKKYFMQIIKIVTTFLKPLCELVRLVY